MESISPRNTAPLSIAKPSAKPSQPKRRLRRRSLPPELSSLADSPITSRSTTATSLFQQSMLGDAPRPFTIGTSHWNSQSGPLHPSLRRVTRLLKLLPEPLLRRALLTPP